VTTEGRDLVDLVCISAAYAASARKAERFQRCWMEGKLRDENGNVVCERCAVARDPFTRMRGLLGRSGLAPGEGLLLQPAASIHTLFMRFPIDAVFLDGDRRVLRVASGLQPWRTAAAKRARAVLELAAGEAARVGVAPGDVLRLEVER